MPIPLIFNFSDQRMFEQHLKSADFYFKDNTCYDVISGARGHHENLLPTLIPRSSLDKHMCGRVDCQRA